MKLQIKNWIALAGGFGCLFLVACHHNQPKPRKKEIVVQPKELSIRTVENLHIALDYASDNQGRINDTIQLHHIALLKNWYDAKSYASTWGTPPRWDLLADSLYAFIEKGTRYGLYPKDYHFQELQAIRQRMQTVDEDRRDAVLWSLSDLLLTDAFVDLTHDISWGRIGRDSLTLRPDSIYTEDQYLDFLKDIITGQQGVSAFFQSLEPTMPQYQSLKAALDTFVDTARFIPYSYIDFPAPDSLSFVRSLLHRMKEEGWVPVENPAAYDSTTLKEAIMRVQEAKGLTPRDGKQGPQLVRALNSNNEERFRTIAINLDRFKQLPREMPETYLMVDLPGFYLQVWDQDTMCLQSKVIVGAPKTRTPELNSRFTNFITYPVWTVPYSIIFKEILPATQRNVGYLASRNLVIVDDNDSIINPASLDWSRYHKGYFPYRIRQLEGNDNSLGVIKFNFSNKYDVYLHDTNNRNLFHNGNRALSHGCVRVQDWQNLADFLVRQDTIRYHPDSIRAWISRSEKRRVDLREHLPLFIRYFTCDTKDGHLNFYDDIYAEDKVIRGRFFAQRTL